MHEAIARLAERMTMPPAGHYLIGFSGGADSVALAWALKDGCREGRYRLEAVHVNHGLRGSDADGDEAFVKAWCRDAGIPCLCYHLDPAGRKDEDSARRGRYESFRQAMRETGAEAVILAHHADDLAETFLMRLLRGAGPEGLGCMEAEDTRMGIRVLRPMLALGREEIREALREAGLAWREDGSNGDTAYLRNEIRLNVIPPLEKRCPGAVRRIASAARLIAEDNRVLSAEAEALLTRLSLPGRIDAEGLRGVPDALKARVLRAWWRTNAPRMDEHELNKAQTAQLTGLVRADKGKINLPGGLNAVRGRRWIHLTGLGKPAWPAAPWHAPEAALGPLTLREIPSAGEPGDGKRAQEVPEGWAEGCEIRTRLPGDVIRPFGSTGTRKLQDYLVDRGVDAPWRDEIPLLCRGREVLLAAGVGAGNIPPFNPGERNVRLVWEGPMPWMETAPGEPYTYK